MRQRAGVAVVLVAGLLAACGVGTQADPETIDERDVPFGLAEDTLPERPDPGATDGTRSTIYLVAGGDLVPVTRPAPTLTSVLVELRALVEGPTEDEITLGVRTAIPPGTTIRGLRARGRAATIDLGGGFDAVTGPERIVAVAQLVYTATESRGVDRVRFELSGNPIEVPTDDGQLTRRAVGRADYSAPFPVS